LILHRRTGEHRAKSFAIRSTVDRRPAALLPRQGELAVAVGTGDTDAAFGRRERTVFGGIGRELMQQQRESRHQAAGEPDIGSADRDPRFIAVHSAFVG
jgi:hypothetical protein